jgi:hypothetical protein
MMCTHKVKLFLIIRQQVKSKFIKLFKIVMIIIIKAQLSINKGKSAYGITIVSCYFIIRIFMGPLVCHLLQILRTWLFIFKLLLLGFRFIKAFPYYIRYGH